MGLSREAVEQLYKSTLENLYRAWPEFDSHQATEPSSLQTIYDEVRTLCQHISDVSWNGLLLEKWYWQDALFDALVVAYLDDVAENIVIEAQKQNRSLPTAATPRNFINRALSEANSYIATRGQQFSIDARMCAVVNRHLLNIGDIVSEFIAKSYDEARGLGEQLMNRSPEGKKPDHLVCATLLNLLAEHMEANPVEENLTIAAYWHKAGIYFEAYGCSKKRDLCYQHATRFVTDMADLSEADWALMLAPEEEQEEVPSEPQKPEGMSNFRWTFEAHLYKNQQQKPGAQAADTSLISSADTSDSRAKILDDSYGSTQSAALATYTGTAGGIMASPDASESADDDDTYAEKYMPDGDNNEQQPKAPNLERRRVKYTHNPYQPKANTPSTRSSGKRLG